MKRLIVFASVIVVLVGLCAPAFAIESRMATPQLNLSFAGTTAVCKATITSFGDAITATMVLKQGSRVIDSWTGSGSSVVQLNEECRVTKGVTYTLELTGTADGVPFSLVKTGRC